MRSACALLGLAVAMVQATNKPLSVCEALRQRDALDNKIVSIRGVQNGADEGAWLLGSDCGVIRTDAREWKSIIWLETSRPSMRAAGVWPNDFWDSVRRINSEIAKRHFDPSRDRLWLTYVGVFKAYDDELNRSLRGGFGHMNVAPAELIVREVRDAVVEKAAGR